MVLMRYTKWIGLAAALLLIGVCFMPWTYHADVQKNFTGFFSEKGNYGKPGKFFIFFAILCIVLLLTDRIWAKRIHLFASAIMMAYAIKTYILYTSCYNAYCPEKKAGIYLVLILSITQFICSVFTDITNRSIKPDAPKTVSGSEEPGP
jgi:hypothetical protein